MRVMPPGRADLELESKRGNRRGAALSLATLGSVSLSIDAKSAIRYLDEAIEISQSIVEPGFEPYVVALREVAESLDSGLVSEAVLESVLDAIRDGRRRRTYGERLMLFGQLDQLSTEQRIEYLNEAVAIFDDLDDIHDHNKALNYIRLIAGDSNGPSS
jgi:hypothetical protein